MTFSGDLRGGISLGDVFQNIAANRTSGTLHVRWRRNERFIRFEEGEVAGFSVGVGKGLPILEFLLERGYVEQAKLQRLLARNKRSRKSSYRLVQEGGLIGEEDLAEALAEHIREHIYDLMLLKEAEFDFSEGSPPSRVFDGDQKRLGVRLDIGPLLMEGARRKDEWERIRRVVSSDRDLFLLLEGWDEIELDAVAQEVTPYLDGQTDVGRIAMQVQASKFAIMKAISDLVHQGVARPCTSDELESLATSAADDGDREQALRLLDSALRVERSNTDLRLRKAELLEQMERNKDAAAEYALLGHDAGQEAEFDEAARFYATAVALDPTDVPLHEKRIEMVLRSGDHEAAATHVRELVDLQLQMGLADRARSLLEQTLQDRGLKDHAGLTEQLARVESSLGHWKESAELFVRLAERTLATDESRALELLRSALEQRPDDEDLSSRIADIESGRLEKRRVRRRRLILGAASVTVLSVSGYAGFAELYASHTVVGALDQSLGDLREGEAVGALADLQDVRARFGWTVAGGRAQRLVERVVDLQLRAIDGLLADAEYDRAQRIIEAMRDELERPDLRSTCDALLERTETERRAFQILERTANGLGPADPGDLDWLAGLTDGRYLDFHLAQLPRVEDREVRRALLRALDAMDSPRVFPVVARLALDVQDVPALDLCERILQRAEEHRRAGRELEWASVYPLLERAQLRPETRGQAQLVLGLLRGTPAVPR